MALTPGFTEDTGSTPSRNVFSRLQQDSYLRQQVKSAFADVTSQNPIERMIRQKHNPSSALETLANIRQTLQKTRQARMAVMQKNEHKPVMHYLRATSGKFKPRQATINLADFQQKIDPPKPSPQNVRPRLEIAQVSSPRSSLSYLTTAQRLINRQSSQKFFSKQSFSTSSVIPQQRSFVRKQNQTSSIKSQFDDPESPSVERFRNQKSINQSQFSQSSIDSLRQQVLLRFTKKHQEPPDLLDMNVIERGNFWTKEREKKIQQRAKEREEKELQGCTFKPDMRKSRLNRSVSSSGFSTPRSATPSMAKVGSYSQLFQQRKKYRSQSISQSVAPGSLSYQIIHRKIISDSESHN